MSTEKATDDTRGRDRMLGAVVGVPIGLVIGLVVALVVAMILSIWLIQAKNSAEDELEETKASYGAGPDAQAAAERILGEMISFDYRHIKDEYDWTEYLANDELRSDYEDKIVPRFRKLIRRTKATAAGEVKQSAYNIIDEEHVNVLAFIRQKLTDVRNKDGVISEQWASLTMARHDGEWLIDDIDIVSVPPPS